MARLGSCSYANALRAWPFALAQLGAEQAPSVLKILHSKLPTVEWEAMRAARAAMPSLMARAVSEVDFV